MLSQEKLKEVILSQEKNIKRFISNIKKPHKIVLCVKHTGEYQIIAAKRKLAPGNDLNENKAHYTATYISNYDKLKQKPPSANKITKILFKDLFEIMETTNWYFG